MFQNPSEERRGTDWHGSQGMIEADFDRIAGLPAEPWDLAQRYYDRLLEQVPKPCRSALDVGCGTGTFTRLLAARSERVLGIDLSTQMIRVAIARSTDLAN